MQLNVKWQEGELALPVLIPVLSWKRVEVPFWIYDELVFQVETFKYVRVLFTSEERVEQETDRGIDALLAAMQKL